MHAYLVASRHIYYAGIGYIISPNYPETWHKTLNLVVFFRRISGQR